MSQEIVICLDEAEGEFYSNMDIVSGGVECDFLVDQSIQVIRVLLVGVAKSAVYKGGIPVTEEHVILNQQQTVFPPEGLVSQNAFTVSAGHYLYPFQLHFPDQSSQLACVQNKALSHSKGFFKKNISNVSHRYSLPPTFHHHGTVSASVEYFVIVTIEYPSLLKFQKLTKRVKVNFLPKNLDLTFSLLNVSVNNTSLFPAITRSPFVAQAINPASKRFGLFEKSKTAAVQFLFQIDYNTFQGVPTKLGSCARVLQLHSNLNSFIQLSIKLNQDTLYRLSQLPQLKLVLVDINVRLDSSVSASVNQLLADDYGYQTILSKDLNLNMELSHFQKIRGTHDYQYFLPDKILSCLIPVTIPSFACCNIKNEYNLSIMSRFQILLANGIWEKTIECESPIILLNNEEDYLSYEQTDILPEYYV